MLFYVSRGTIIPSPYTYDEPDYMYAASLGGVANAVDSPSMPLIEFVKTGLDRGRDTGNQDRTLRPHSRRAATSSFTGIGTDRFIRTGSAW